MNNKLILFLCLIFCSCATSKIETNIANDFIQEQLLSPRYLSHKNAGIILVKEAGNGINSLNCYEKEYQNKNRLDSRSNIWILDSLGINNLKRTYKNVRGYYWKESDFRNLKFAIMDSETNRQNFKKMYYVDSTEKLILYISKPLIIKNNYAFIAFHSFDYLGSTIEMFTVLMKKVDKKWQAETFCYDNSYME